MPKPQKFKSGSTIQRSEGPAPKRYGTPYQSYSNNSSTSYYFDDEFDDGFDDGTYYDPNVPGGYYDDGYYGRQQSFNYDYESSSKTNGAASSWWRSKFKKSRDWTSSDDQEKETALFQDLKEIARTVNAVRNSSGSLNREKNLKVAWTRERDQKSRNNTNNNPTIYLSPDPLTKHNKIKTEWTEDQRRDALIGEALTLTAMKRTLQPTNVKKVTEYEVSEEVIRDIPLFERTEQEKTKLRFIARELWKSLETYKSQAEMLKEYRGCRAYFSAYLAFYSDKAYRDKIQDHMNSVFGTSDDSGEIQVNNVVTEEGKLLPSIVAASALSWNVNHANIASDQIEPPNDMLEDIMIEAFDILMDGVNMRSTFQRWECAVQAAEILATLDKDEEISDEEHGEKLKKSINDMQGNQLNGSSNSLFGGAIENASGEHHSIECADLDENGDDSGKGFMDISDGTILVPCNRAHFTSGNNYYCLRELSQNLITAFPEEHESVRANYSTISVGTNVDRVPKAWEYFFDWNNKLIEKVREETRRSLKYMRDVVEPYAEAMYLPEHGMRSGRISGNSLWKVPTSLPDNDRVFHRKQIQGDTRQLSIGLLMDYSGSMQGPQLLAQKKLALILHDLFSNFPTVDLKMYGHNTSFKNEIFVFDSIETVYFKSSGGGTNEGTALGKAAEHFYGETKRKDRNVILTIGDGFSDLEAIKKSVRTIRSFGIEVYDILIDGNKNVAEQAYGQGKCISISTRFLSGDSSVNLELLGLNRHSSTEEILQAQVISVVRPWVANLISKMQVMGGIQ